MMKKFKTIGVLGGMGPAASAHFYNLLIKKSQELYNAVQDDEFPQIIINSLSLSGSTEEGMENNELISEQLIKGIKVLKKAGADFIVIPCNSVHNMINILKKSTSIPIISIIEGVSKNVIEEKVKKVLILSSETSKKYGLYDTLEKSNIQAIKPDYALSKKVTILIYAVMGNKKVAESAKKVIVQINKLYKNKTIDSVILGCTELPLAINQKDTKARVFDSLEILAIEALEYSRKN